MTVIDGDYEYYLYKREDLAQRAAEGHLPVTPLPSKAPLTNVESTAEPVREGKKTKEQRRAEAAARAELNRRLKGTKDKLKNVEAALEVKRARYDELMELMASEELYADQEKFSAALGEYTPSSRNCPTWRTNGSSFRPSSRKRLLVDARKLVPSPFPSSGSPVASSHAPCAH